MSITSNSTVFPKLAAAGLIILAFGLGGCGRKGALDLPPGAASAQVAPDGEARPGENEYGTAGATAKGNVFDRTPGDTRFTIAPKGPKKKIILDPLLD